jgi:DNA-binding response OmpR family regulator
MPGKRILVVDDEADIVDVLKDILAVEGYQIDAAANATEAFELIRENIYDAAILDFNLPDMDGVMLHRKLREMDAELASHTLFISGLVQTEKNLGYYEAYGQGFVPKPFQAHEILASLNNLWMGET